MLNGKTYYGESGYLQMLATVLKHGVDVPDRTGVGSRAMVDAKIIFQPGELPTGTSRPTPRKFALEEMKFFMGGHTQTKMLEAKGIEFWKGNTTREFLDKRGLDYLDEGDFGEAYGFQWRGYNKNLVDAKHVVDQLDQTISTLKKDPFSRRVYTTFWNPSASSRMALTPCWHSHQFVVLPDSDGNLVVNLKMFSRSLDILFGYWAAVFQYKCFQLALIQLLNDTREPESPKYVEGALISDITQHHIYSDQQVYVEELLERPLGKLGTMRFEPNRKILTIDDLMGMEWSDFVTEGLEVNKTPFKTPRPEMAA